MGAHCYAPVTFLVAGRCKSAPLNLRRALPYNRPLHHSSIRQIAATALRLTHAPVGCCCEPSAASTCYSSDLGGNCSPQEHFP